ncbi:hypothetical protein [Actinotalea sp.]|uniref:hypothetical protein n=1 Tax=Actinotalea sp. TaxID=1872145 RepID=UPI00356AAAC3
MTTHAPYAPGDPITVLHHCATHGTEVATFPVERIKSLATNGQYRVTTTRCDGTQLDVEVNAAGVDRHGYVRPGGAL